MMNSHAANASWRCTLLTPTRTIWSPGGEPADAVDHAHRVKLPARARIAHDRGNARLGHAGIVLELQGLRAGASAHSRTSPVNSTQAPVLRGSPRSRAYSSSMPKSASRTSTSGCVASPPVNRR